MATAVDHGVVDHHGRVFDARGGTGALYRGLYISDGAQIPTALGVNPSLTIAALALRTADAIIDELPAIAAEPATPASATVPAEH